MGGATRFLVLIGAPFSLLRPQSSSPLYRLSRLSLRPLTLSPIKPIHTHSNSLPHDHHYQQPQNNHYYHNTNTNNNNNDNNQQLQQQQHPWPEWLKLLRTLSSPVADVHGILPEDAVLSFDYLSDDFVRSAAYCLAFARNRPDILGLLSRKDIVVIVENGTPFLFQSALDTGRRMRAFLSGNSNALESDKAQTVDLMKYLLSYASNPSISSERNNLYSRELIESSVRNLLNEFADVICGNSVPMPEQQQVSGYYGHTPRPLGHNIEMKKGDWICTRCNFMNFARNLQCLECEQARPKRQLNGGEWECPQCDFYNYSRNTVCLRCDCRRPGGASFGTVNSGSVLGHNDKGDTSVGHSSKQILGHTSPCPETDNKNIGGLSTTVTSDVPTSGYLRDGPSKGTKSGYVPFVPLPADMFPNKAQSSNMQDYGKAKSGIADSVTPVVNDQRGTVSVRDQSGRPGEDPQLSENSKEVQKQNDKEQAVKSKGWFNRIAELHNVPDLTTAISDEEFPEIMPLRKGENRFVVSKKKDRSLTSPMYKRQSAMEQANDAKFVPFVPFPPDYFAKRDKQEPESSNANINSANEAYSNSQSSVRSPAESDNARRGETNWNQEASTENQQIGRGNWTSDNSVNSEAPNTGYQIRNPLGYQGINNDSQNVRYSGIDNNREASTENQQIGRGNWSSNYSVNSGAPTTGYQIQNPMGYQGANNDSQNVRYSGNDNNLSQTGPSRMGSPSSTTFNSQNRYSGRENAYQTGQPNAGNFSQNSPSIQPTSNSAGTKSNSPVNQNVRSGWSGKSLEGSAVKDPDPLDMSEEAKTERWFRRVAQIKDISELSQIPDEDFPSIMPMRKGVNRFVVSKRKTPLERRLTSPQYRRNLPVVRSDPVKDNDSN